MICVYFTCEIRPRFNFLLKFQFRKQIFTLKAEDFPIIIPFMADVHDYKLLMDGIVAVCTKNCKIIKIMMRKAHKILFFFLNVKQEKIF